MFAVPPLWRDVDAYNQTVLPPGMVTILLHGPLYCNLSRIPLWFGYLVSGAGPAVSLGHFIKHSQLTNAGVFALLLLQHAALWLAAIYLIFAIATTSLMRLFLAALFASHPLFYTFAHCVGSESLSMILTLLLGGSGLRIMLRYPEIAVRDWVIFTVLLSLLVLTRHINCVLAAVLPITILALLLERCLHIFVLTEKPINAVNSRVSKATPVFLVSIAAGLIGLFCATGVTHFLCRHAHTPWRSTFGYTFLWRLNFLETMQPAQREALLTIVASKCKLPESSDLLAVLSAWMDQNTRCPPPHVLLQKPTHVYRILK